MTLDSGKAILIHLRTRLLTFVSPTGATWANVAGVPVGTGQTARLWRDGFPSPIPGYPAAYMRMINDVTSSFSYGQRITFDLELIIMGKPLNQQDKVSDLADLADQAFLQFVYSDPVQGLLRSRSGRSRNTLPFGTGEAEPDVVQVRSVFPFTAWAKYLTSVPT